MNIIQICLPKKFTRFTATFIFTKFYFAIFIILGHFFQKNNHKTREEREPKSNDNKIHRYLLSCWQQ